MAATSKPIRKKMKHGASKESLTHGPKHEHSPSGKEKKLTKVSKQLEKHSRQKTPKGIGLLSGNVKATEEHYKKRRANESKLAHKIPKSYEIRKKAIKHAEKKG